VTDDDDGVMSLDSQARGYATHMVGKWNVGQAREAFWPHKRGFDTAAIHSPHLTVTRSC